MDNLQVCFQKIKFSVQALVVKQMEYKIHFI